MVTSIDRLKELVDHFKGLRELHYKKSNRARTFKTSDDAWSKYILYRDALNRCYSLARRLYNPTPFGYVPSYMDWLTRDYTATRMATKAAKRTAFENSYHTTIWFMQASFSADYGTFECSRCHATFYHSPSEIRKGKDILHKCACGYCTNSLTGQNIYF